MAETSFDNYSMSPSYSLKGNELEGSFDHTQPQEMTLPKKTGLANVFSKDTLEIKNTESDVKKASEAQSGWVSWILGLFGYSAPIASTDPKATAVGSLDPTLRKPNFVEPNTLKKVIEQLQVVNNHQKENLENEKEINLDIEFMKMNILISTLREELAKTVSDDVIRTNKTNAAQKKESQKNLEETFKLDRSRGLANTAQYWLGLTAIVCTCLSAVGVPWASIVKTPLFITSQILVTTLNQYYKIKQKSHESLSVQEIATIKKIDKKIKRLLSELQEMIKALAHSQKTTVRVLNKQVDTMRNIQQR